MPRLNFDAVITSGPTTREWILLIICAASFIGTLLVACAAESLSKRIDALEYRAFYNDVRWDKLPSPPAQ